MRWLIFSDVHANIFTLRQMLREKENLRVDRMLSLGDVIGYNSYPVQALDEMKKNNIPSLIGNHEAMITEKLDWQTCKSERGQHAARTTRAMLNDEQIAEINRWPEVTEPCEKSIAWHAAKNSLYNTVNTVEKAAAQFEYLKETGKQTAFFGHTHRPGVFIQDVTNGRIRYDTSLTEIHLESDKRYLINPGTLGEPRHGLPVSYIIYDTETALCRFHIVETDARLWKKLRENNRKVFGITSLDRLPAQVKEISRKWYYKMGRIKDSALKRKYGQNAPQL